MLMSDYQSISSFIKLKTESTPYLVKRLLTGLFLVFLLVGLIWYVNYVSKYSFLAWLIIAIPLTIIYFSIIKKYNGTWLKGLTGENDIQGELRKLPEGYVYIRNIESAKSGNIDFVVLGPNGIWAIEVKSHDGSVTYDGNILLHNKWPFEKDFLRQSLNQKKLLEQYIQDQLGMAFPIIPVIVFSSSKAYLKLGMKPLKGVYVIQKRWLLDLIVKPNDIFLKKNTMYGIVSLLKPFSKTLFAPTVYEIKSEIKY